jgi:hypothetical protein
MREYVLKKLSKVLSKPRLVSDAINSVEVHLSVVYFPKVRPGPLCGRGDVVKGGLPAYLRT